MEKLDSHFVKYIYKGTNPFGSKHVKQTPHEPNVMWSSNKYYIIFKVGVVIEFKKYFQDYINILLTDRYFSR